MRIVYPLCPQPARLAKWLNAVVERRSVMSYLDNYPDYIFKEDGTIYSKLSKRILKPSTNKRGYQVYRIKDGQGVFVTKSAHRLFAEAFLPNFDISLQVDHIDGDKHNNHITNLQMVTASENMVRAVKKGLVDNASKNYDSFGYNVRIVSLETNEEKLFDNLGDALEYLGYSGYTSWSRVKNTTRILRGYKIYIDEPLITHSR